MSSTHKTGHSSHTSHKAEPAPTAAPASAPAAAKKKVVIRAEHGKPLPNPPHGGSWSRDPDTGDLTLMEGPTPPVEPRKESAAPDAPKE